MSSFNPATYTTGEGFVGWATNGETPSQWNCPSLLTWTANNRYAGCVATTGGVTELPTSCNQRTLLFPGGVHICDGSTNICGSIAIFNELGDSTAAWTQWNCYSNWYGANVYRTWTATTTVTSTSTLPPNTDAGTITGTYTPTSTGSFSSARPTDSPPSSDSGGSSLSAGAIAGIVVGSVAGILILISLLFRRKILACFGYRKADQSVYSPVYPLQTPTTQFSPEVGNISQPQSPPPWDKPELAGHVQPTAPVRVTPHEME